MLTIDDLTMLKRPFRLADHEFARGFVYIKEDAVTNRIEEVDPAWRFEVLSVSTSGKDVVATARMTIKDVSRDGIGMHGATLTEPEKSAVTDALKRCARLFGVGRYLLNAPQEKDFAAWLSKLSGDVPAETRAAAQSPANGKRPDRDMNAIFEATRGHWRHRKHFDNGVRKLVADGVLNSSMTDAQAIAAIHAVHAPKGEAGAAWWSDADVLRHVNETLEKRHGMNAAGAAKMLGQGMDQFAGPDAFLEAVGANVLSVEAEE